MINLLPSETAKKRSQEKVKKLSTLGALGVLVGISAVALGVFVFKLALSREVSSVKNEIENQKKQIVAQKPLELKAQTLGRKVENLDTIFTSTSHYSILLDMLLNIKPDEVVLTGISTTSPEKASLSGTASGYIGLAKFVRALSDPKAGGKLFKNAVLTSVSLDSQTAQVKFNLDLGVNKEAL